MTNHQKSNKPPRKDSGEQPIPPQDPGVSGIKPVRGPNWRRVVGALVLVAALVFVIKQWNRTRKVDLTLVVVQKTQVRSVTVQLFDPRSKEGAKPVREVRMEGSPGADGRTFSLPAGPYILVLRTEKMDGSIQRTERKVSLSADAKLTLQVR